MQGDGECKVSQNVPGVSGGQVSIYVGDCEKKFI
jgi:hypothetical protein